MKTTNITKKYGGRPVVDGVSFDIRPGKLTSFIGPNGAGKSTVMSLISRLVVKDTGSIIFKGEEISQWKNNELSQHLAILTQSNHIDLKLTIEELVAFGRFPYSGGNLTEEDKIKINEALEYMELNDIRDKYLDELSGGQRQRAYIAMVIAQDTDYVLLDEPTNNLDIYHASKMMQLLRRLCDDLKKTVILVLHDINYASFYSDDICAFKDGKILKYGSVTEVMQKEVLEELYQVDFKIMKHEGKPLIVYY